MRAAGSPRLQPAQRFKLQELLRFASVREIDMSAHDTREVQSGQNDVKRAYAKPELVEYGQMRRLTLQSSNANSGNQNNKGE
jgi:hypothetical protein